MNTTVSLVAIAGAALFASIGVLTGGTQLTLARLAVCGAALAAAALIDLREHRIPNRIVLPAAAACALLGLDTLRQSLSALALVGLLLVLALVQPAALGMGDVKGAFLVAIALGTAATPALLLGLALAALTGIALTLREGRTALASALPLAPFFAAGATIALLT
jgi:leader peptidase (prepilin peptidase) / N-methyltransferase